MGRCTCWGSALERALLAHTSGVVRSKMVMVCGEWLLNPGALPTLVLAGTSKHGGEFVLRQVGTRLLGLEQWLVFSWASAERQKQFGGRMKSMSEFCLSFPAFVATSKISCWFSGVRKGKEPLLLPVPCGASEMVEPGTAVNPCKTVCFYHLSLLID